MKKTLNQLAFATLAMSLVGLASCQSDDNGKDVAYMLPETRAISLTADQQAMVAHNNEFSFNLARLINEGRKSDEVQYGQSMFVSPVSVTYMLGMLNDGANADGQKKISNALGLSGATAQQVNEFCNSMMTQAPKVDEQVKIETANAVFTNKQWELTSQYEKNVDKYYGAKAQSLDFTSQNSLSAINGWAKDATSGMIPNVLDRLDPMAALYLFNTVYFEAVWTKQFDKANTTAETFISEDGTQGSVQMMHNTACLLAGSNDIFTSVCLPYGSGDKWNMYVMLPNEGKTVDDVLNSLNTAKWNTVLNALQPTVIEMSIPKFSVSDKIDMEKPLSALGLGCLFDGSSSVLSQMCKKSENLFVNEMFQKSHIDVNEEGAKATVVTVADVGYTDAMTDRPTGNGTFTANRPFVYVVTESSSNAVFFIGTYTGK